MRYDITKIYYFVDEFCKIYNDWNKHKLLPSKKLRNRACKLTLSEMLTIMICYHLSGYKCFKYFYQSDICIKQKKSFKEIVCYARFVQLMPTLIVPLYLMIHMLRGEKTGVYFIDATTLPICHNKRISRNKVFAGIAERGKSTMGWFFGFKLHVVINNKGQIMAIKISKGNVDDRVFVEDLTKDLTGLLAADKGYLSKKLFQQLYNRGLKLLTGIRKTMKNILMPLNEKFILRKRFLIETKFDLLKNIFNLSHSRHRSALNFFTNTLSAIVALQLSTKPNKNFLNLIHN
jgi:hypothetical protein